MPILARLNSHLCLQMLAQQGNNRLTSWQAIAVYAWMDTFHELPSGILAVQLLLVLASLQPFLLVHQCLGLLWGGILCMQEFLPAIEEVR